MSQEITGRIYLEISGRRFPVASFRDASEKVVAVTDRMGIGNSRRPTPLVYDGAGNLLGYVAYNGSVFAGRPRDWNPETPILHDGRIVVALEG